MCTRRLCKINSKEEKQIKLFFVVKFTHFPSDSAFQAATILVAMASEKKFWRPKFWRKSPIGNQQIKRETYLKNDQ